MFLLYAISWCPCWVLSHFLLHFGRTIPCFPLPLETGLGGDATTGTFFLPPPLCLEVRWRQTPTTCHPWRETDPTWSACARALGTCHHFPCFGRPHSPPSTPPLCCGGGTLLTSLWERGREGEGESLPTYACHYGRNDLPCWEEGA